MKRRLRIAFIDDGICDAFLKSTNGNIVIEHWRFDHMASFSYKGPTDILSHGTVCASIFAEYATDCDMIDLTVFFFFSSQQESILESVLSALLWCASHKVDLISMSMGTLSDCYGLRLKEVLNILESSNTLLLAACCNNNRLTYPACFNSVLGVRSLPQESAHTSFFCASPIDGIEIYTTFPKNCKCIKEYFPDMIFPFIPNSWSTPYVAALLTNMGSPFFVERARKYLSEHLISMPKELQYKFYDKFCNMADKSENNISPIILARGFSPPQINELICDINSDGYICVSAQKTGNYFEISNGWYSSVCSEMDVGRVVRWINFFYSAELIILTCNKTYDINNNDLLDLIISSNHCSTQPSFDVPTLIQFHGELISSFSKRIISSLSR